MLSVLLISLKGGLYYISAGFYQSGQNFAACVKTFVTFEPLFQKNETKYRKYQECWRCDPVMPSPSMPWNIVEKEALFLKYLEVLAGLTLFIPSMEVPQCTVYKGLFQSYHHRELDDVCSLVKCRGRKQNLDSGFLSGKQGFHAGGTDGMNINITWTLGI